MFWIFYLLLVVIFKFTLSFERIQQRKGFRKFLLNYIQKNKISQGFWGWSVDTIMLQDSVYTAYIFEDKQYKWDKINLIVVLGLLVLINMKGIDLNPPKPESKLVQEV